MKPQVFRLSVLAVAMTLSSGLAMATTLAADTAPTVQNDTGSMAQLNERDRLQAGEKPENRGEEGGMKQNRVRHQMRHEGGNNGHPELFSAEERADFRDRMRSAETREERHAIRDDMRTARMERAEAAGIERPEHGGMGMRGERPDRPAAAGQGDRGRAGH